MAPRDLPIELVFRVLPDSPELKTLREAILSESIGDRSRRWNGSAAYSTMDQRVVPSDTLADVIAAAEARSVGQVRSMYASLAGVLDALSDNELHTVLDRFVDLGEAAREEGAWQRCSEWFRVVHSLATEWGSRDRAILASRRIGLAELHLGNVNTARDAYETSMQDARLIDNREGRIVAHIGLGHVLGVEGRWTDAQAEYINALNLCEEEDKQLAGQVEMNLAMTCRESGDYTASQEWLDRARARWETFSRAERSVWYNSQGMLLIESGDAMGARSALEQALAHSGSYFDTAMILDNLAHLSIREGDLARAEGYARRAEEFAVVGNASRALAEVYIRLATITRLRGEENGIGFLEKAIELSRAESYHQAHARALQEYALLRERMQDFDAARDLRLEAAHILDSIT